MNPKIEKLEEELRKNTDKIDSLKGRISTLTTRNKAIARKVKELQNTDLIGMFEELNMTPEEFAAFAAERKTATAGRDDMDEED